ncbi:A disintegrin and metalloproteinase with thrombospondin motifs like [Tachypleus tridentatus]|uniref:A disintegrin and metalloproteinase with thrombospondin motifs like n=1 Tax=Tachypleus tridentatus TaxID=6853 RepID=UPI003FD04069
MWPVWSITFLMFVTIYGQSLSDNQIHTRMSVAELGRIFQVETHDQVPDYEVVHVRSISKREANDYESKHVFLKALGRNLQLKLNKNNHFDEKLRALKFMEAKQTKDGLVYREVEQEEPTEKEIGSPYHDETNMAAVLVRNADNGKIELDGTIGEDLVIKPLPLSLGNDEYVDDEMFLDEDEETEIRRNSTLGLLPGKGIYSKNIDELKGRHIVYKRKMFGIDEHSDYLPLEFPDTLNRTSFNQKRVKRQIPEAVWPEVLLVVDYDTFKVHGHNNRDIKRYYVSFWNGVDLRYKIISNPKIRVSLAGMIVGKDRDATPYLEENRLKSPNNDAIDAAGALTDLGKYLYREDRLPTYDVAVVITKLDMCRRRFEGGRCNRGTAGFAYVGGACVVNKRLEKVNSVAIIEDSGGFSGIIVAAHELGHLLGCVHDGSPPPSYLGGPGATRCPWEDGFIMSDLRHTERGFRWSRCSLDQFKHFLSGDTASCLYNFPHEKEFLPRVLPGSLLSLDEQCKLDRGTTACFKDARVCAQLFCYDIASGYCVSYRPAAEGSPCGDGQVCRNGHCLAEIENIIPDFSEVTQTYAERPPTGPNQNRRRPKNDQPTPVVSRPSPPTPLRFFRRGPERRVDHRAKTTKSERPIFRRNTTPIPETEEKCEDSVQNMSGDLPCKDFLHRFGYRYCNVKYMQKKCCLSHKEICSKG